MIVSCINCRVDFFCSYKASLIKFYAAYLVMYIEAIKTSFNKYNECKLSVGIHKLSIG
jgi:hypothetical protein